MGVLKPARNEARENDDLSNEILCDLDLIATKKATFILHGKTHVLLPVTTEAFLAFWQKVADFKKIDAKDATTVDRAYLETIKVLCKTLKLDDVKKMSIMQRSILIESLAGKVVGDNSLLKRAKTIEDEKKKLAVSPFPSASLN
jgi:hypothetical protein